MREIKKINWEIKCSWIRRYNNIKMSVLSGLIYRFNVFLIKISAVIFVEIDKIILKFVQNEQAN